MSGRHSALRPRRARSWPPLVVAVVGALGLTGGLGTQAYWNDTAALSGTTLTSGSLDLQVGMGPDSVTWDALSMTAMAPGESTAESLVLTNAGTTPFTVAVTGTATASSTTMLDAVQVQVFTGGTAAAGSAVYPRGETCGGALAYSQTLDSGTTIVLAQSDPIVPGGTLDLCVRLELPLDADDATQLQTYAPSFSLTATQVAS